MHFNEVCGNNFGLVVKQSMIEQRWLVGPRTDHVLMPTPNLASVLHLLLLLLLLPIFLPLLRLLLPIFFLILPFLPLLLPIFRLLLLHLLLRPIPPNDLHFFLCQNPINILKNFQLFTHRKITKLINDIPLIDLIINAVLEV